MANVKLQGVVDYAGHEIYTKEILNRVHRQLLKNNFKDALSLLDEAAAEIRLYRTAVKGLMDAREREA